MAITDTELAGMVAQTNTVISAVKEPAGVIGWWSQQHRLSMLADISAVFKIDAEPDSLNAVIGAVNHIGMAKYRIAIRFLKLLHPIQMALINGVVFEGTAKQRTRALGLSYIEVCRAVKLGALDPGEVASDKGLRILKNEFKRQLRTPRPH